jgi:protein-tyrosine-phosphatase
MKKPFKVHFICTGNTYRSRLAETYLKSLNIPNVTASSSGIEADKHRNENGPISWYALRLIAKYKIMEYISLISVQTKENHIIDNDYIILMHPDNYQQYKQIFNQDPENFEIWDIPDLHHLGITKITNSEEETKAVKLTEETFEKIKKRVDKLAKKLSSR